VSGRAQEVVRDQAGRVLANRDKLLRDPRGRLPRVRDVENPVTVGVHPAESLDDVDEVRRQLPPFVRRDRSDALESAVRRHAFVLVVGESTAGKSRAAFEAVRVALPDDLLVAPDADDRQSWSAAVAELEGRRRCVVWSDDVERFLGTEGFTKRAVQRILDAGRGIVIVATIRSQERARLLEAQKRDGPGAGGFQPRGEADVLALAHEIRIERRWSTQELQRARSFDVDPRIERALSAAEHYGNCPPPSPTSPAGNRRSRPSRG